jgi:hypothetical protein
MAFWGTAESGYYGSTDQNPITGVWEAASDGTGTGVHSVPAAAASNGPYGLSPDDRTIVYHSACYLADIRLHSLPGVKVNPISARRELAELTRAAGGSHSRYPEILWCHR